MLTSCTHFKCSFNHISTPYHQHFFKTSNFLTHKRPPNPTNTHQKIAKTPTYHHLSHLAKRHHKPRKQNEQKKMSTPKTTFSTSKNPQAFAKRHPTITRGLSSPRIHTNHNNPSPRLQLTFNSPTTQNSSSKAGHPSS
jgi:hypothetical protein